MVSRVLDYLHDFLTKGDERSVNAKKNIVASLVLKSISFVVNLLLVPLSISYVTPSKYGIWVTLSSIILWFGIFDIGFGNGLRNKFTEAKANGKNDLARVYISTTYVSLAIIFGVVWFLFLIVNFFLDWSKILNAPGDMAKELSLLALIVFAVFCLQTILKIINIVLLADQKPAFSALLDLGGQLFVLILLLILKITTNGSILYLGLVTGLAPVIVIALFSLILFKGKYKSFAPSVQHIKFKYAKDMLQLGSLFFGIQISIIIIFQTRNIIIAQLSGPESVAIFNVAYKYFSISYFVFGVLISPFWSAYTDAYTKEDFLWMKKILKKLEILAVVFVIAVILQLVIANLFYRIWIGKSLYIKNSVSIAVALFFITQIFHGLYTPLLNGLGKIKLQFIVISILAAMVIPISLLLGTWFGLEGIILASVIVNLVIISYAPRQVHALLNRKAKGIWNK